ncbi:MAG: hypothetical protein EBS56_09430 [Planctomycetia bacterium]|nr:hypothetical protein [Planctomycetia bacterium]
MPRNFARHEQFLRIFALLELLSAAHQPLDDQAVIAAIKDRLGLARLSPRTLRRDCDFLRSCGYPVDHTPLPDGRKYGWTLAKDSLKMGLHGVPASINGDAVEQHLAALPGVSAVHDLHIWPMSTTETAMTAHLVMPAGHPGDGFLGDLSQTLAQRFAICHATVQIETSDLGDLANHGCGKGH